MRRPSRALVAAAVLPVLALSACGGSTEPERESAPPTSSTATASTSTTTASASPSRPTSARGDRVVWAALGDSYASGTGTGRYDVDGPCMRGTRAYPELLAARDRAVDLTFLACAGATTDDVLTRQVPQVPRDADVVTISVGGNDAGFFGAVPLCLSEDQEKACLDRLATMRSTAPGTIGPALSTTYAAVARRAPRARIVAIDYPQPFSDGRACAAAQGVSAREAKALDRAVAAVNEVIERRAKAAGVTYVPTASRFRGHGVCARTPWVNGLTSEWTELYHPSAAGHRDGFGPLLAPHLRRS